MTRRAPVRLLQSSFGPCNLNRLGVHKMSEADLISVDLGEVVDEIDRLERQLYQLEAMRRQLEHDMAEATRQPELETA